MSVIKAFLIEPQAGTIRPVTINRENSYLDIKAHLNCDMIDIVRLEGGHDIIVDDNGLAETLPCITEVTGGQTPLAGNLLFTKSDEWGELVDVTETIKTVASLFTIVRPVLHPVIVVSERPGVIATHLTRIEISLDRSAPKVVEAAEA
ncbi:hypothetical protein OIU34_38430 [Pararhizobium sp. BT-229]|uniref:DUF3846 domain-containing protein n=1 Tax=Pararhizobium sp. BT-229 TaxID=2986923 RepID=UPI0021F7A967|nr:hypothetical protein [Pararhizobium sp. BT-229]MCV9967702.1 hypothetical protein [Pararhizobium sp. BT-229]